MNKTLLATLFCAIAWPAMAALPVGKVAPEFTLNAALDGEVATFDLRKALSKGPVVVYFYPSAYTAGCNVQAHEFSVHSEDFKAAGASVIGVSLDSVERLKAFSSDPEYCAGKLAVASDSDGQVAKAYGLKVSAAVTGKLDSRGQEIDHGFTERTTFIITPNGKIAAVIEGVSPKENVSNALEKVKELTK